MNDFIHRLENNIQRPAKPVSQPSVAPSRQHDVLTMTREQLEQALQDSEMQEILHNARISSSYHLRTGLREAIIDRLFMWQSVNRSIPS